MDNSTAVALHDGVAAAVRAVCASPDVRRLAECLQYGQIVIEVQKGVIVYCKPQFGFPIKD